MRGLQPATFKPPRSSELCSDDFPKTSNLHIELKL